MIQTTWCVPYPPLQGVRNHHLERDTSPQLPSTWGTVNRGEVRLEGNWVKGAIHSGTCTINFSSVPTSHLCWQLFPTGQMLVSSIFRVIEGLFVSPHLPPDAAWVCLAGIELGMHSRVRAAPEGRSLTFREFLGPKQDRDSQRQSSGGWRKEICQGERGGNLGVS